MKKKLTALVTVILLFFSFLGNAQDLVDEALLFSRTKPGGSARIQAMGGAQISLGGDYSAAFSNPAGLGMFNRSEFSLSPGMNFSNTNSKYLDNASKDSRSNFFIPGLSGVFQKKANSEDKSFLGGSFGITFNHTNNFNSNFNYEGVNPNNSIVDYFIRDAAGHTTDQLDIPEGKYSNNPTGLAYSTYLLDLAPNSTATYESPVASTAIPRTDVQQQEFVETKGSQKQWSFSYGANFSDKIFVGASIGFASIRYEQNKDYIESNYHFAGNPSFNPLTEVKLNENLDISGSGINATLGIIGRPLDMVQVGFSYTLPTLYQLTDIYSATMNVGWNNFDYYGNGSKLLTPSDGYQYTNTVEAQYELRTPGKLNLGVTAFIQKKGLISADVEMVDYGAAKYSTVTQGLSYSQENEGIKATYKSSVNFRVGGEYRLKDYRLRAGYSFMPDPYNSVQNGVNNAISSVTGGAGYRGQKFYIDLAAIFSAGDTSYRPYSVPTSTSPVVTTRNKNTTLMMTLGIPF
jgi:hypothetical protein